MTDTDTAPPPGSVRGFVDRDTVRCECGHVETIIDDGEYRVVPTGRYRWRTNPETSEVWQEDEYQYICPRCFAELPDA